MKIGVDFDDVLSQTMQAVADFHNEKNKTNFKIEDFKSNIFSEVWGGTLEEDIEEIKEFHLSNYDKNLIPLDNAKEILEKLKLKNELYIITARSDIFREHTEKWIEENFPKIFSKVYFTNEFIDKNTKITKSTVCNDLDLDIFIDDNLKYATECSNEKRKVFLMNYPWNHSETLPHGVTRVNSWKEIGEFLS